MTRLSTPSLFVLLLAAGSLFAQAQESNDEKALFFDGIDDYANAPFLDFNKFTDGFTIEAWHMNWLGYVLSQGAVGDPENSLWLSTGHALFDGCGWEDNERDSSGNYAQHVGLFRPSKWTHLAIVFDGEKQMVFVNGQLVGERLFPAPGALTKSRDFVVGAEPNFNDGGSWSFGSGFLRSVRVSSVARYDSEFKPATTLKSDDNTVLLYSSTAIEGDQLVDLSGNKHHAKLHGSGLRSPKSVTTRLIEGSVFGPDGNLANGMLVFLQRKDKYIGITKTDDSGRYFFVLNNPTGEYNVESGDWTFTVAGRWASTMEGEVEGIAVDKGDGTQVDVKLRDTSASQAESGGETAFKSYLNFAVGGVWTITIDGERLEHSYRWVPGRKFVQLNGKGGILPYIAMIGIDPLTEKLTWWIFNEDGSIGKDVMTEEREGVWLLQGHGTGEKGDIRYKGRISRVDENTIEEQVMEFVAYGEEQKLGTFIWKRKR